MKALLLDFASRWLSGFILCQAFCSRHVRYEGKTKKPQPRSHTWEAHCQGPQTQQRLWCGQCAERHPGVTFRPPSPPHPGSICTTSSCWRLFQLWSECSFLLPFFLLSSVNFGEELWVETCFLCHLLKFTTLLFSQWVWSAGVVRYERLSQETALVLTLQHVHILESSWGPSSFADAVLTFLERQHLA